MKHFECGDTDLCVQSLLEFGTESHFVSLQFKLERLDNGSPSLQWVEQVKTESSIYPSASLSTIHYATTTFRRIKTKRKRTRRYINSIQLQLSFYPGFK
jgi:hypothetical protein